MGNVYAEITLKNGADLVRARDGSIKEQDVRSLKVTALVDTGATTLIMGENLCRELGLAVIGTRAAFLAGGAEVFCKVTEPVQICWKDRTSTISAWVLPGDEEVLLGVIPLEEMDLIVNPVSRELAGAHGDKIMGRIKSANAHSVTFAYLRIEKVKPHQL